MNADYLGVELDDDERAEQLASMWRFLAPLAPLEVLVAAAAIEADDLCVHEERGGTLKFFTSGNMVVVLDRSKARLFWSVWDGESDPGDDEHRVDGFVELSRIVEDGGGWGGD